MLESLAMIRTRIATFAAVLCLAATACGGGSGDGPDLPNPVIGVITKVGPDHIAVKTEDGQKIRFDNADTESDRRHLELHRRKKLRVSITHERNGDRLIARTIADAPTDEG